MATSIQVSWAQLRLPDASTATTKPSDPLDHGHCGCGCGCTSCAAKPGKPRPKNASPNPIRYGTGELVLEATDLHTGGFGLPWGHTRSFASRLSDNANIGHGYNWQVAEWSYLVF